MEVESRQSAVVSHFEVSDADGVSRRVARDKRALSVEYRLMMFLLARSLGESHSPQKPDFGSRRSDCRRIVKQPALLAPFAERLDQCMTAVMERPAPEQVSRRRSFANHGVAAERLDDVVGVAGCIFALAKLSWETIEILFATSRAKPQLG